MHRLRLYSPITEKQQQQQTGAVTLTATVRLSSIGNERLLWKNG